MENLSGTALSESARIRPMAVLSRSDWGAVPPKEGIKELKLPVPKVVVSWVDVPFCITKEECTKMVQDLQRSDMNDKGFPDIQYNFLVGEDGRVYEGRGWKLISSYPPSVENSTDLSDNSLHVALLQKPDHELLPSLTGAFFSLVGTGVRNHSLDIAVQISVIEDDKAIVLDDKHKIDTHLLLIGKELESDNDF